MDPVSLAPVLTPQGHLTLMEDSDAPILDPAFAQLLRHAFARGSGHGLFQLGAREVGVVIPPVFSYWRELGSRFVTAICTQPNLQNAHTADPVPPPADTELEKLASIAPPMTGAEYLTGQVLRRLWQDMDGAFRCELKESKSAVQEFLKILNPAWNLVGRVHFNLAENRNDEDAPFAFLATYTTLLSAHGKARHVPLGQALREYAGASNKGRLLSLLHPVQRATESCSWLKLMVDAGEIFHPLRWTPQVATRMLRDVPQLESAGIVVRMPAGWKENRPLRPQVIAKIGGNVPSRCGGDALLDFRMDVVLGGEPLTSTEIKHLLSETDGLTLIRGRWVEVDRLRLQRMIKHFGAVEKAAARTGLSFSEAMRMLAGANVCEVEDEYEDFGRDWSQVVAGPWLAETLRGLRDRDGLEALVDINAGNGFNGTLRPYQQVGVRWLYLLAKLGLGACLADDMGLGKTIQVISLLMVLKLENDRNRRPSLLIAPASLLANWASEIQRFTPSLKILIAHKSAMPVPSLKSLSRDYLRSVDLIITSYGSLLRTDWFSEKEWRLLILDEAQAIKNPTAKQTKAAKQLVGISRFALTGTPIENRLGDMWSIFDFINPGLLGSAQQFTDFTEQLVKRPHNPYGPLRELVRPYILRRLKTDKAVISDLPDKTEVKAFCSLSIKQAALYQDTVDELASLLHPATGIQRKGLVLSFLMRFKQICNHPSQWLGDGAWTENDSGKWSRLREIAEVVAARQEKMLVFTQFREVTTPLADFLGSIFGRSGLVLHGGTDVKKRMELVRRFQEDEAVGFFVLSLKAGGAGLNLTAASHVLHFDRWWNPAVENQATDRAFRIGQKKNVLVHKFLCRGTVEEKINELIESKRHLSEDLLAGGGDLLLTELEDEALLNLVALDINAAMKEA
jgi:non-specific serine/threonine protein kinase